MNSAKGYSSLKSEQLLTRAILSRENSSSTLAQKNEINWTKNLHLNITLFKINEWEIDDIEQLFLLKTGPSDNGSLLIKRLI